MKKAHSKRLSIPRFFEEPKLPGSKISSKIVSKPPSVYNSCKNSPNSSCMGSIKKIVPKGKVTSKKLSPRGFASCQNSPPRDLKKKPPSQISKKTKQKKITKRDEKLFEIKGDNIRYAPKIFENQLFIDVYDELGRHDRVMEIQDTLTSERTATPVIIFNGEVVNDIEREGLAPPGNSFEETCQDSKNVMKNIMKDDLFAKLEKMAKEQQSTEE